ncbi:hypothetical protein KPL78_05825 [Roseomonas sp. HJA6]|uniref:Uncharacterized protein n=1 Tax=Roseomonas alba TaxID=2846776 RepID=A0ABS7A4Y5_9PROT|nr:hypothetical protein [Neoroseomonas alba]MBW6397359.1 hypothetical protein [Neoroseomonas alba]
MPLSRRTALLALPALLAGCSTTPVPIARMPYDPSIGFADPARQAIIHTAYAFAAPASLADRPWEAAEAISQAEFLTIELTYGPRWIGMTFSPGAFVQARPEWRAALGIDQSAEPQAVIDAFTAVRYAYGGENPAAAAAALRPPLFTPGGEAALRRLSALPPLPRTAWAASLAQREMWAIQRQNSVGNNWE